jgi:cellulose biosynthesis protein BcsQ
MRSFAFFNNKGGVGKTTLVYHLTWMFRELGHRVVAVDLDPQANLSSMFLSEDRLEEVWNPDAPGGTLFEAVRPLLRGTGDISEPRLEPIEEGLGLLVGDLALSEFEDSLAESWSKCLAGDERSFRVMSAFGRLADSAAHAFEADIVVLDVGPNLGSINRAALIASDFVVVPLGPDLFSLQGLRNLGPRLRQWREGWDQRRKLLPKAAEIYLPEGRMEPLGYVVMRYSIRLDRPVRAYERWLNRIPGEYRGSVLGMSPQTITITDEHRLAQLKDYRSLMPMAQEANKPMFLLKPADGAIGGHQQAVHDCYIDFKNLAQSILARTNASQAKSLADLFS